jgi:ribosomal protein S12 methylthiotransferase accessory factor
MLPTYLKPEQILEIVTPFVGGRTGMIGSSVELPLTSGNPEICVYTSFVSRLGQLSEEIRIQTDDGLALSGAGTSRERKVAHVKAYCEALERYCNVSFDPGRVVVATREELGEAAVDLDLFPRGSEDEYNHPRNFLVAPSNREKMRWIPGYSLVAGQPRLVPMASVYLSTPFQYPGEAFALPITTGCALAASYEQATIAGICEVIERDALMLTWLQQLSLPRIDLSEHGDSELAERLERVARAGFEQHFFDATSDLGVPTIYAIQTAPHSRLATLVMAATRLNPLEALVKLSTRLPLRGWPWSSSFCSRRALIVTIIVPSPA